MALTPLQRRTIFGPRDDPVPVRPPVPAPLVLDLDYALDRLRADCARHEWTRDHPKARERALELGVERFICHIPASTEEMDLPWRGQVRFIRRSDRSAWHIILWFSWDELHVPICGTWSAAPRPGMYGQSQRPNVSLKVKVCAACSRKLERLIKAGKLDAG